jgi:hypothetical protein
MTNSWMNEDGEPIMDGAAWRFEQQLDADSRDDYYADRFYDDEPEYMDPATCSHPDVDYRGWTAECRACETDGIRIVNSWPIDGVWDETTEDFILWPAQAPAEEGPVMEDQWLDSYMEDRISSMYE